MTIIELIVTAAFSNVGAVLVTRVWAHYEHVETKEKIAEVHVLVNSRLSEALERIKLLEGLISMTKKTDKGES